MSKSLYRIEIKKSRGNDNENGNINIKFHIKKLTINNQQLIIKNQSSIIFKINQS
jgi:hypothetical protein